MVDARDPSAPAKIRNLTDTIRRVRIAEAERSDVVVELREAERARLDMLADEMRQVFADVPADDDQFIFAVVPGNQPRLWIDQTSFVALGRDRRTYRFLKDTRLGRTVIVETASLEDMADTVTEYIAERIIERERAIEADWLMKRLNRDTVLGPASGRPASLNLLGAGQAVIGWIAAAFLFGILIGAGMLFTYAWVTFPA